MGSKMAARKTCAMSGPPVPQKLLVRQMSDVISLREKVAQAQLMVRQYGVGPGKGREVGHAGHVVENEADRVE